MDSRMSTVRSVLNEFTKRVLVAKESCTIDKKLIQDICALAVPSFRGKITLFDIAKIWVAMSCSCRKLNSSNSAVVDTFPMPKSQLSSTKHLASRNNLITARRELLCFRYFHKGKNTTIHTLICSPRLFQAVAVPGSLLKKSRPTSSRSIHHQIH